MEGKGARAPFTAVIMGVLILGLVVAQVEAQVPTTSCCKNTFGRTCYNTCRRLGTAGLVCANLCDCIIVPGNRCPSSYPSSSMFENSGSINEYCNLGCVSSMCDTINTVENSGVGEEEMKVAVEHCKNACSEFCNKGTKTAVASA